MDENAPFRHEDVPPSARNMLDRLERLVQLIAILAFALALLHLVR